MEVAAEIVPDGPPLAGRGMLHQWWRDLTYLHWAVEPERVAHLMPRGVRPDVHEGRTWVGLIPFTLSEGGFGAGGRPVTHFGTFLETNVRLYSVDAAGRRGVVFVSLEAERLAPVVGANALLGVPYKWARMSREPAVLPADPSGAVVTYRSTRRTGSRPATEVVVRVGDPVLEPTPLQHFLSARFGAHTAAWGRTLWVPNTHSAWPLREAELVSLDDELVGAAGLPGLTDSPPESVLFSSGVHTVFGRPVTVR